MRAVPLAALMLAFSPIELSAQSFALNAHATVTSEVSIAAGSYVGTFSVTATYVNH